MSTCTLYMMVSLRSGYVGYKSQNTNTYSTRITASRWPMGRVEPVAGVVTVADSRMVKRVEGEQPWGNPRAAGGGRWQEEGVAQGADDCVWDVGMLSLRKRRDCF